MKPDLWYRSEGGMLTDILPTLKKLVKQFALSLFLIGVTGCVLVHEGISFVPRGSDLGQLSTSEYIVGVEVHPYYESSTAKILFIPIEKIDAVDKGIILMHVKIEALVDGLFVDFSNIEIIFENQVAIKPYQIIDVQHFLKSNPRFSVQIDDKASIQTAKKTLFPAEKYTFSLKYRLPQAVDNIDGLAVVFRGIRIGKDDVPSKTFSFDAKKASRVQFN